MTGKLKRKAGSDRAFATLCNRADAVAHRYGLSRYEVLIIAQQLLLKSVLTEADAKTLLAEAYAEDKACSLWNGKEI